MITQQQLKDLLAYDLETGIFHWKVKPSKRFPAGMQAGSNVHGYIRIHIKGKLYGAHRLAWLYVYGHHPSDQIDHINGNPSDNRISNLREADSVQNAQNRRRPQKNNSTGLLGVAYDKTKNRYRARIYINGKRTYIGKFKTPEEAHAAYIQAKRTHHTFNTL
jgi:hypothetical protein